MSKDEAAIRMSFTLFKEFCNCNLHGRCLHKEHKYVSSDVATCIVEYCPVVVYYERVVEEAAK